MSCANHGVSFFINEYCEYYRHEEECRFCSLVPTQRCFADTLQFKKPQDVNETMSRILELGDRIDFVQISGGSIYDHDREVRSYVPYVEIIRDRLAEHGLNGKIPVHLTCMPPNNLEILWELKEAGLDTVSFDLECPTQAYFEKYCPGKTRSYGYLSMRRALEKAITIFGAGNVFSIVILGIEPVDTFVLGVRDLISSGVAPTINIYHHDPLATKMDLCEPDYDILIAAAYEIARDIKRHDIRPGMLGCAHYDIGHDIRKGYFDEP